MGYRTTYIGKIKFTQELIAKQIAFLSEIMGEDIRDYPEWNKFWTRKTEPHYYIAVEFTKEFDGLIWDGSEKVNDMDNILQFIINIMRSKWPEFGLDGSIVAQGENFNDRYTITINGNTVEKIPMIVTGTAVKCPECGYKFVFKG